MHTLGDFSIRTRGRTARKVTCGFCKGTDHKMETCSVRQKMKMQAHEYLLSTHTPEVETLLKKRMKYAEMITPDTGKGTPVTQLTALLRRSNFSINEVGLSKRGRIGDMDTMLYHVTFLSERGEESDSMWLSGSLFHSLLSHGNKKIKYVYDRTIYNKAHWVSVERPSEESMSSVV